MLTIWLLTESPSKSTRKVPARHTARGSRGGASVRKDETTQTAFAAPAGQGGYAWCVTTSDTGAGCFSYTPLQGCLSHPDIHQGEKLCGRLLPAVLAVSENTFTRKLADQARLPTPRYRREKKRAEAPSTFIFYKA